MTEELVDVFDEAYQFRGRAERSLAYVYGMWINSFHCWIYSESDGGKIVFQKRSATKKLFPNALDISAAGHLLAGESPADGVREVKEELGVEVNPHSLISLGIKHDTARIGDVVNRQFAHVYLLRTDLRLDEFRIDVGEVSGIVEVAVGDGLALFSGEKASISVRGLEFDTTTGSWVSIQREVTSADFIPRVDSYYYKVFILVKRAMAGERYLAI